MSSSENTASLPYHEPGIVTILIISSFLLLLNAVNYVLDRIVYCGLVGQLFIGIGWGMPGANWLSAELQDSIVQLGYIGLILIVYEGKNETSHGRETHSTNTNSRRHLKQPQGLESKSLLVLSSSPHRHRSAHWPLLRPSRPPASISRTSLRRRSSTMFDIAWHHFHRSCYERSHRESSRRRTV